MPDYPERAVLEGIVNALIHRNYLELGSEVHIDIFDDRLEIYSPGGMCDGTRVQERDLMRVPSRRRNPVIAITGGVPNPDYDYMTDPKGTQLTDIDLLGCVPS